MKVIATLIFLGLFVWDIKSSCPKDDTFCARCGGDKCLVCMAGFSFRGVCQLVEKRRRVSQCIEYDSNTRNCKRCNYGYKLMSSGFCARIKLENCLQIDPDLIKESCILCDKRMLPDAEGKCALKSSCSIENCMLCKRVLDEDESEEEEVEECVQCTNNFTVFRDETNKDKCIFQVGNTLNCRITEYNNPEECLECDFSYYYSYGRCIKTEGFEITMNYSGKAKAFLLSLLSVPVFLLYFAN